MIFDNTVPTPDSIRTMNQLVGPPITFWEAIRRKGRIGSQRMILEEASLQFSQFLKQATGTIYANLELRPKGILVHISVRQSRITWAIPFHLLSIFQSNLFSIHAGGQHLKFRKDKAWQKNQLFVKQIMLAKNGENLA